MSESYDRSEGLDVAVGSAVRRLQREFRDDVPRARALLARLRQAVDEDPGVSPQIWEFVMEVIPESDRGRFDAPSYGEWATHLALTFYAVHQQGNSAPMHVPGVSFGSAAGTLVRGRAPSTKGRYDAALLARSFPQQRRHLRGLIGLMKADSIPLDYGQLAVDLYLLQNDKHRGNVLRRWGRDFYRSYARPKQSDDDSYAESPTAK